MVRKLNCLALALSALLGIAGVALLGCNKQPPLPPNAEEWEDPSASTLGKMAPAPGAEESKSQKGEN